MIDRTHRLPVTRQAELVGISRGSVYYVPKPVSNADLTLMRRIRLRRHFWQNLLGPPSHPKEPKIGDE